jgi:hypothetical protein
MASEQLFCAFLMAGTILAGNDLSTVWPAHFRIRSITFHSAAPVSFTPVRCKSVFPSEYRRKDEEHAQHSKHEQHDGSILLVMCLPVPRARAVSYVLNLRLRDPAGAAAFFADRDITISSTPVSRRCLLLPRWRRHQVPAVAGDEFDLVVSLHRRDGHGPAAGIADHVREVPDAALTAAQLADVCELAEIAAAAVGNGQKVLVRCHSGFNRSGLGGRAGAWAPRLRGRRRDLPRPLPPFEMGAQQRPLR